MKSQTEVSAATATTAASATIKRRPKGIRRPGAALGLSGALFHAWKA